MARHHHTTGRRAAAALAVALLGAASLLGCSASDDGDAAEDERTTTSTPEAATDGAEETTTTEGDAPEATTTTDPDEPADDEPFGDDVEEGLVDGLVEEISGYLEASSIDPDQQDCLIDVFERSATGDLGETEVEAAYVDCGSSTAEVGIATIEGLLLTSGASEEAASCVVDELSAIPAAELEAAIDDPTLLGDLAAGCDVPADLLPG